MNSGCVNVAYGAGVNYFFFCSLQFLGLVAGLRRLLKGDWETVMVATGTESRNLVEMRAYFDRVRRRLGVNVIDVFCTEYVSPSDNLDEVLGSGGALEEIWRWKGRFGMWVRPRITDRCRPN